MKQRMRIIPSMLLAALSVAAACSTNPGNNPQHALVVEGGTLITLRGHVIDDGAVVIQNGEITAVGPRTELDLPRGAKHVNAQGKFVVPGLVDMHVHLPDEPGERGDSTWRQLSLMVANGVTTARSMAGHPGHPELRDAVLEENRVAPYLYVAAPAIHQGKASDAATARELVRNAKDAGFDLVKSHHIEDPAVWRAVQNEARRLELPVAGHLAATIPLADALRAGQQVEHLDGYIAALLPNGSPARNMPFGQFPPPSVLAAVDASRIDALAREVAEAGGWSVPTLALFEKVTDTATSTENLRAHDAMRYVNREALEQWSAQREQLSQAGVMQPINPGFTRLRREIVRALHDAGAGLLAGSDTPQAFHLSGFGLHEELAALQSAGVPPMQVLAAATRNAREYFQGLPNNGSSRNNAPRFGVIAPGMRADLLLLDADPRHDVAALKAIDSVILRGRVLDRAALDSLLEDVADSVKPAGAPGKVVLLRHAETTGDGQDPGLSEAGRKRAEAFADRYKDFEPRTVFATPTRRARETAAIIAAAGRAPVAEYDPRQPGRLVEAIRGSGGNVIVIGHSNTVLDLAGMFNGEPGPAISPDEHDRIYEISLPDGATRMESPRHNASIDACRLPGLSSTVRCGVVRVAESDNSGRMLDIHFAVLPATGEAPRPSLPPLLIAPGGPGLGGVQSAAGIAQLFAPFRESRDILLVDQRGTGKSNRLDCPLPEDAASAFASMSAQPEGDALACRETLSEHADLAAYTTPIAVRDLEKVRLALGFDTLDLFGMSYGTRIAFEYARQFPGNARAIVIRAPAPPAMQLPLHTAKDADQALAEVMNACKRDAACNTAFPDLPDDVQAVLARLEQEPVNVRITDPRNGEVVETAFDRAALNSALFFLLYIPEYYRQLPALMNAAAGEDFQPLVQSVAPLVLGTLGEVAWGMRWSVICNEDVARIDRSRIDEKTSGTFFGRSAVDAEITACDLWPPADIDPAYFEPPRTGHPVMIISGTMDPVAPPRWGEYLLQNLDNAIHLPVTGASHLPVLPGCTGELMREFLEDASLEGLDTSCAQAPQVPAFVTGTGT